jgi:hypothetical protein
MRVSVRIRIGASKGILSSNVNMFHKHVLKNENSMKIDYSIK